MTVGDEVLLEAHYDLPASLTVEAAALGREYQVAIAGLRGQLVLPALEWDGDDPAVIAPTLQAIDSDDLRRRLDYGFSVPWGWIESFNPRGRVIPRVELLSAVLRFPGIPSGAVLYGEYRYGRGHPRGPLIERVFEGVDAWFDRLRLWASVVADQDTDVDAPWRTSSMTGAGLQIWAAEHGIVSTAATPHRSRAMMTEQEPLSAEALQTVLDLASRATEPAPEHLLLVSARAALRRRMHRTAILEAATACELALHRLLVMDLAGRPEPQRSKELDKPRPLGPLIKEVEKHRRLPSRLAEDLVSPRNDAMHRNLPPDRPATRRALELAAEVVALIEPLPA